MTEQFSSHILYTLSYSVLREKHTEFYSDFTEASQVFAAYQRELNGLDYHQCALEDVTLCRAQVEIPNTLGFLDNNGLLSYVNSAVFSGTVTKTLLNILYLQSTAE